MKPLGANHPGRRGGCAGMSLIEIMVAMFLLTVIMLGLISAFYQTQRALKLSTSQTDVLEGGRTTLSLLARELQEIAASKQPEGVNLLVTTPPGSVNMPLVGGDTQTNRLQDFFFLRRRNDVWTGLGFFLTVKGEGLGTLYRFSATNDIADPHFPLVSLYDAYGHATPESNNVGRVAEGIVHLTLRAFDTNGVEFVPGGAWVTNDLAVWTGGFAFSNRLLPAFLDLELGIVDAQVYKQFRTLGSNSAAVAITFLTNQAGKVYLFRQRIPIRHHEL